MGGVPAKRHESVRIPEERKGAPLRPQRAAGEGRADIQQERERSSPAITWDGGMPDDRSPVQHAIAMRRVDRDTNVARFYVPTLERDLFGNFAVTRQWAGRGPPGVS